MGNAGHATERPSILVVDDTVENLHLLSTMLTAHGYEVRPVTSGWQALRAGQSAPPDLVLLDVMMPDMDGYEVCRRLKSIEQLREIPVIFLTALSDTSEKLKAFEAGGADHITKPFQVEEVLARVNVHIELGRSRRQLVESFERLRAIERLRDDLVHMIVHDMRSSLAVLGALLFFVQERTEQSPDGALRQDVEEAIAATTRLNRMTSDVVDVSRLEEGKLPLDRALHDVVAICRGVVERVAKLDPARTIRIEDAAPLELSCDRSTVERIVENILINAVKYGPAGGRITLAVTRSGTNARVSVRDEGPGIPPEARTRIFEKFGTVPGRRPGTLQSAGLGLAFCKLAVEAHGGSIGVEPAEPKGSEFWFELPV